MKTCSITSAGQNGCISQQPRAWNLHWWLKANRFNSTSSKIEALLSNLRVQVLPFDTNELHWDLHGWHHYSRGATRQC